MKFKKKSQNQVGIGIIVLALLLLAGGIFLEPNNNNYNNQQQNSNNNNNSQFQNENYLFYLNSIEIGRQNKITQTYSNIELGSKKTYDIIYIGNNFILNANPLTSNSYEFTVNLEEAENINNLLIYFNPIRSSGKQKLKIYIDNKLISDNFARKNDIPIKAYIKPKNSSINIKFELEKPSFYDIFNWNKFEVYQLKIVEEKQNKQNNIRKFKLDINKENLEKAYINLAIKCDTIQDISPAIKIEVNNQTIENKNPNCKSRYNIIKTQIPTEILNNGNNQITLQTNGLYKVAMSINKIYFNDQDIYKFNINSFNDLLDVVIYGDFDKEVLDLRINQQTIEITRNQIKSILPYLRYGINEIKILNKPVEIKKLVIEKNQIYN